LLMYRTHARVHLRLRAGLCLIKLAKVRDFDREMSPTFESIVTLAMDTSGDVRHKFLVKLGEVLPAQRLLPRWNMIPAFSAGDPDPDNIALVSYASNALSQADEEAKSIMINNVRACGHMSPENQIERIQMPLARLILQVSHLPDAEWDLEGMKKSARSAFHTVI
jgi:sister-chromatid-cohesion protein PDS5